MPSIRRLHPQYAKLSARLLHFAAPCTPRMVVVLRSLTAFWADDLVRSSIDKTSYLMLQLVHPCFYIPTPRSALIEDGFIR